MPERNPAVRWWSAVSMDNPVGRARVGLKPQPYLNRTEEYVSYGAFGKFTPCLEKGFTALSDYKTFSALLRIGADFQKCLGIKRFGEALTRSFRNS